MRSDVAQKTKKNVENSVKKFIANTNKKSGTDEILKKELLDVLLDGEDLWLDLANDLNHQERIITVFIILWML